MWGWGKRKLAHPLDRVLFNWTTQYDPFRVRDLLNGGCLILGRAGSGKTSSSGRKLMQSIVDNPQSGGLILAAKPEDGEDIEKIFAKARRLKALIVFDAEGDNRCNFLSCLKRPRDVVQFLVTMSEIIKRGDGKGGDNSRFYDQQEERALGSAVAALQAAREPLTAANLHKFIKTAATSAEELSRPEWRNKYHSTVLERGFRANLSPMEKADFELALDMWLTEWAVLMDAKTRGNILAGLNGTLFTMNSGIVREMVCGEMNCSPADILAGKWVLCNFPPSTYGQAGLLISAGWKQLTEQMILERKADDDSPFCVIWADEAATVTTAFDATSFIPQCRSHKGCLVYLTQGVSSFYAALGKGEAGKHQANNLMSQFSHVIAHSCDPESAKWLASKLGKRKEMLSGGGTSSDGDVWEWMWGRPKSNAHFSEHYEAYLQDQEFMVGRTGGPSNRFICDAYVLKSGESFSNGMNYLRVAFSQKG